MSETTTTTNPTTAQMIIREANVGPKIEYTMNGTFIDFRDGECIFNIAKRQEDYDSDTFVWFDNSYHCAVADTGARRIAMIHIPAKTYHYEDVTDATTGAVTKQRVADPFDLSKCVMTLWAIAPKRPNKPGRGN